MDTNGLFDRIEAKIPDRLADPLNRMGSWERGTGLAAVLLLLILAVEPVSAQEHCSSAVTAMFDMAFGLTFGYAREVFIVVILIAGFLVLSNGISSASGVVGLGVFALAIVVLIAYMLTIDFVTFGFDQIGAPESCTGQFSDGTGS